MGLLKNLLTPGEKQARIIIQLPPDLAHSNVVSIRADRELEPFTAISVWTQFYAKERFFCSDKAPFDAISDALSRWAIATLAPYQQGGAIDAQAIDPRLRFVSGNITHDCEYQIDVMEKPDIPPYPKFDPPVKARAWLRAYSVLALAQYFLEQDRERFGALLPTCILAMQSYWKHHREEELQISKVKAAPSFALQKVIEFYELNSF
jgi:hypothetical protein